MKLEKYGIKMQGLKKAAGETKGLDGWNGYVQISYDRADGEVMAKYHVDVNDWTRYHSNSIISVCNAREPMTISQFQLEEQLKRFQLLLQSMVSR